MIIAFSRVHYGADYLGSVIRSVLPFVDKFVVLYTPFPSDGFRFTPHTCPDSRDELYAIAHGAADDKLDWRDNLRVSAEVAMSLYPEADLALELDADEVIHPLLFEHILEHRQGLTARCYRLPFWHHWRRFGYVCEDAGWPARLYLQQNPKNGDPVYYDNAPARVHHFGYARKTDDMRYKWETSVHLPEIRREWWSDIWDSFPMRLNDLHPVTVDMWNARPFAAANLPPVLHDHAYAEMDVIP